MQSFRAYFECATDFQVVKNSTKQNLNLNRNAEVFISLNYGL